MIIQIEVKDRVARYIPGEGTPVCGNGGDTLAFLFDEEWADVGTKTARFIWNGSCYHDETFTENTCPVPVFLNVDKVLVGIYTEDENGDPLIATTRAEIPYRTSVRCGSAQASGEDSEGYVNLAKQYAKEARDAAECALDFAEIAQTSVERLERLKRAIAENSFRIGEVETQMGIENTYAKLILNDGVNTIPDDILPYVKIAKIYGNYSSYCAYESYWSSIPNPVSTIQIGNKMTIGIPSSLYSLPNFGVSQYDYIYFSGGSAYYHQGTRWAEYYDPTLEEGEHVLGDLYDEGSLVLLAQPIITDISDRFSFDGFLDLSGCKSVTLTSHYTEDDLKTMAEDAMENANADGNYTYHGGAIELAVEKI